MSDNDKTPNLCPNGHDKNIVGVRKNGNGCNECKREASRRFAAARKAGVPLNATKRQPRVDLGYAEIKNHGDLGEVTK